MWNELGPCPLTKGKTYDIEAIVLDYLPDPPQSTTNESELRYHYLLGYNNEQNLFFLTQYDIIQHISSFIPKIAYTTETTELTWTNLHKMKPHSLKLDIQQGLDILMPELAPLGYKSILKPGSKIRIPNAVLGYTGGRSVYEFIHIGNNNKHCTAIYRIKPII